MEIDNQPIIDSKKKTYLCPQCGCNQICDKYIIEETGEKGRHYCGTCPVCHIQLNWCGVDDIFKEGE